MILINLIKNWITLIINVTMSFNNVTRNKKMLQFVRIHTKFKKIVGIQII
jgi:hypothetical protein